jgi:hypothetical protein
METIFVEFQTGNIICEKEGIILLDQNNSVILEGEKWKVMSESSINLDIDSVVNYIWKNPEKDK